MIYATTIIIVVNIAKSVFAFFVWSREGRRGEGRGINNATIICVRI